MGQWGALVARGMKVCAHEFSWVDSYMACVMADMGPKRQQYGTWVEPLIRAVLEIVGL